jgi:hypothetical protein
MIKILFPLITVLAFTFVNCGNNPANKNSANTKIAIKDSIFTESVPKLKGIWETPSDLKIPESVLYTDDGIFVSNIDGSPTEANGQGFISLLDHDGKIKELKWVIGLNAPKGMGVWNNKLFVADIHELVEIDISEKTILHRYTAENSLFLNDIAIDFKGRVYISDMKKNVIYRFTDGKLEEWLKSDLLLSPNGLFSDQGNMMIGTKNNILKVNIKDKSVQIYIDNTGSIDGLEAIGDGRYIFSDWIGHIHIAGPDTKKVLLLDTTPDKINAADIQFIPSKKLVLVPTFLDNRLRAYQLDY